jgi:hypothetical protein
MLRSYKFPFSFDPEELRGDLDHAAQLDWPRHHNQHDYVGNWTGIALRARSGAANDLILIADREHYQDTPLLEACPHIRAVLDSLHCPKKAVRLLKLAAGATIKEHVDHELDYEDGEVRLHVPIVTDPEVHFYLDGDLLRMGAGECWYTNVNLPHRVENLSAIDRVHLVIDCVVNDWLRGYLDPALLDSYRLIDRPLSDRYYRLILANSGFDSAQLIHTLSTFRGQFTVQGTQYLLTWKQNGRAWTITLAPITSDALKMTLKVHLAQLGYSDLAAQIIAVESMPDPKGEYAAEFEALIAHLQAALPMIQVVR